MIFSSKNKSMNASKNYIKEQNKLAEFNIKVDKPVAVICGGTSGVGEGTAYAFAKHTRNPTIYIVGRNHNSAERVLENLNQIQSSGTYKFLQHDLSLIQEAELLAKDLEHETKINSICWSIGQIPPHAHKTKTSEGLDTILAIYLYVKFRLADLLCDKLGRAADLGEPARFLNIGNPTSVKVPIVEENIDPPETANMIHSLPWITAMTNLGLAKYARLHPGVSFIACNPRAVGGAAVAAAGSSDTLKNGSPWYSKIPLNGALSSVIPETAESSGERMYFVLYVGNDPGVPGLHLYDRHLHELVDEHRSKGFLDVVSQELVYKHISRVIKKVKKSLRRAS